MQKFTVAQFIREFSTEAKCIAHLAELRFPDGITCPKCEQVTEHYLIAKRKCYECKECGNQFYPTKGTIFYRSRTPLTVWFYVVFQMAQTRCGVSAKEIERQTGVTYKTAWKMCQLVRAALAEGSLDAMRGTVEIDEAYVGGKPRYKGQSRRGRGTRKQPVFGIVERGEDGRVNRVRGFVVSDTQRDTLLPIIADNVEDGSTVYSDEYAVYRPLGDLGYGHDWVQHRRWQYAKEEVNYDTGEVLSAEGQNPVHTNSIEGFWSHVKGGVTSVHKGVSPRYLQRYVDEFAFRHSNAKKETPMFTAMLSRIADAGQPSATLP